MHLVFPHNRTIKIIKEEKRVKTNAKKLFFVAGLSGRDVSAVIVRWEFLS